MVIFADIIVDIYCLTGHKSYSLSIPQRHSPSRALERVAVIQSHAASSLAYLDLGHMTC
jgi:hypothetical protein